MKRRGTIFCRLLALGLLFLPVAGSAGREIFLAGRELSPGIEKNGTTYGVLFAGWTVGDAGWAPVLGSNGGSWMATINRKGTAGFESCVVITGGKWSVQQSDGPTYWGRVLPGTACAPDPVSDPDSYLKWGSVTWPIDPYSDIGCGTGVAVVRAEISLGFPWGRPWKSAGTIEGCLDDQEWLVSGDSFRLPPRIWGTMTFD